MSAHVARETLRVISGAASGTEIPLNGEFVVGRGESGSGNLADDTEISRRHARFRRENGSFVVEDLGSTNGTFVNGHQVTGPTVLKPGDEIKLGRTLVKFDGVTEQTQARPQAARPQATAAGAPQVAAPAAAAAAARPLPRAAATGTCCRRLHPPRRSCPPRAARSRTSPVPSAATGQGCRACSATRSCCSSWPP